MYISVDTETEFLGSMTAPMVGASLFDGTVVRWVRPSLIAREVKKMHPDLVVLWNAKYDLQVLRRYSLDLTTYRLADGMIAAYLIGEPSLGLKPMTLRYLGYEMDSLEKMLDEANGIMLNEHLHKAFDYELTKQQFDSLEACLAADDLGMALRRRPKLRAIIGEPPEANVRTLSKMFPERLKNYACDDADATYQHWPLLEARLKECNLEHLFWDVEMPLVPVLADMERRGLAIDRVAAKALHAEWDIKLASLEDKLAKEAGLESPGSPQQVAELVYGKLGITPFAWTAKDQPSTAAWVLERIAEGQPVVQDILEWRKYMKLNRTYLDKWLRTKGRVHPDFNQVRQQGETGEDAEGATATGRMSSSGKESGNFQNIPKRTEDGKRVRSCVVAEDGHVLLSADYKQLEWVILGILSGCKKIMDAYVNGYDIHAYSTEKMGLRPDQRDTGKRVTYLWVYGGGAGKIAQILGVPRAQGQRFIDGLVAAYPEVAEWREAEIQKCLAKGYTETMLGRRRYVPELASAQTEYEYKEASKWAYNMPPQGTAADIIKIATSSVDRFLKEQGLDNATNTGLVACVHDETVTELPKKALTKKIVGGIMERMVAAGDFLPIPLQVDAKFGEAWGKMTAWKEV